jgi:N utilization substance protein A
MRTSSTVARSEFAGAIAQIANERKISKESIYDAIKQALVVAYRKQIGEYDEESHYYSLLDYEGGQSKIMKAPVLKRDEETEEVLEFDQEKAVDVTPAGFGRVAAQTAKQVIIQKIRESEKNQIIEDFSGRIGEMIHGQVLRMNGKSVLFDIGRGYGIMPPEEQMRGEFYRAGNHLAILIKGIRDDRKGKIVVVSRADKELIKLLFAREVPEISSGSVEIVEIAREAGLRTKMIVKTDAEGIDPVGSCVGQKGVRVQQVIKELNNEKIDIISYSKNKEELVKGALAPADNLQIKIDEENKMIDVVVPDDQISLAIGRGGQNVRLAAKLLYMQINIQSDSGEVKSHSTGKEEYEIDTIKNLDEATREALVMNKLTTFDDMINLSKKFDQLEITDEARELLNKVIEKYKESVK